MPKRVTKSKTAKGTNQQPAQWLTVQYQPVSLFSLKRSDATSMAARSNLVPTPYAIKMALLKVLLEEQGYRHVDNFDQWMKPTFNWIRDLTVLVRPPERLVVNRNGYKLRYFNQQAQKDYRKAHGESPPTLPMQGGFVFREWVHLDGALTLCVGPTTETATLECLFSQINYFGKRGCFFQYLPVLDDSQKLTDEPIAIDTMQGFTVQPMDDLGANTTFERISPFSDKAAKLGKDRVITTQMLPLKLVSTGARYDVYQRCDDDD